MRLSLAHAPVEGSLGQDFREAVISGTTELKNATVDAFCMDRTLVA